MAFETEDDLISELRNWFDNLDVDFFRVGINSLLSRWQNASISTGITLRSSGRVNFNLELEVPLPLSRWVAHLAFLLPLFFNFAVFYDVYSSVLVLVSPSHHPGVAVNVTFPGLNHSQLSPHGLNESLASSTASTTASVQDILAEVTSTLSSAIMQSLNGSSVAGLTDSSFQNSSANSDAS
ncbi:hypothetical protein PoB_001803400 [Plakobranchus ocellatus]|uniref:Uncharacterized protein n=1 Tax=Plakobranchus ocellatus TaxID=259542 RepID=A0AAV3Z886_9GAST|nr:hypothetical protein PoB_001803400 [Plakobranchus ocellatus]